jgi:hypothetical protein
MISLASTLANLRKTWQIQFLSLLVNVMQEEQLTQGVGGKELEGRLVHTSIGQNEKCPIGNDT